MEKELCKQCKNGPQVNRLTNIDARSPTDLSYVSREFCLNKHNFEKKITSNRAIQATGNTVLHINCLSQNELEYRMIIIIILLCMAFRAIWLETLSD